MADLQTTNLYAQKQREFGTRGAGLARFDEDFIDAANRAIIQMNRWANLATAVSEIATTEATVTGLDDKYEDVLSDGLSFHLLKMGRRPPKDAEALVKQFHDDFADGVASMYSDLKNISQDADDENDSIGLADVYD